jgi:hypothetical protein
MGTTGVGQSGACYIFTTVSRMLKKSSSVVLASFRPSTYPKGYASGLHSLRPCWTDFLSILTSIGHSTPAKMSAVASPRNTL